MISSLTAVFFVLGLIIGSFLNVVIYRLNTTKSLGGRSACMSCQNKLSWYELVPLFSFLVLKGRCRSCKTKISIQYPLVELTTGLIFSALFFKFQTIFFTTPVLFTAVYAYYAIIFSLLVVIATYDIKHKIIPDMLCLAFNILTFIGLFLFYTTGYIGVHNLISFHVPTLVEFLSGFIVAFPFAFFWLVSSGKWMGLGDAKLALGVGWLLGLTGAISSLAIAFWTGAIVGIALIILRKNSKLGRIGMKSEIPFAPFLILGMFLVFMFGLNFFNF